MNTGACSSTGALAAGAGAGAAVGIGLGFEPVAAAAAGSGCGLEPVSVFTRPPATGGAGRRRGCEPAAERDRDADWLCASGSRAGSRTNVGTFEGRGALGALQGAQAQLFGIGEVEDVELEDIEQTVHRLGAEAATGVEEIGHVGLLKTGVA